MKTLTPLLLTILIFTGCSEHITHGGKDANASAEINTTAASENTTLSPGGEVIHGHVLPPEPDPAVNNATLLGVDVNNNGVRDDVERWIYMTYDTYTPCENRPIEVTLPDGKVVQAYEEVCEDQPVKYHKIVSEIAMQGARAAQIIIQEPEKARDTRKYVSAAIQCEVYFSVYASDYNETNFVPTSLDIFTSPDFKSKQFNTVQRARAYAKYNMALSGGVYSANETSQELREACDFDVDVLLKEQ
jgi:hypothetical protein